MKRPLLWGFLTWIASAAAGATALVLGDFGAPAWVFGILFLWLATIGLPTLLSVLLVALLWGQTPGLRIPSLGAALGAMAALSLLSQVGALALAARVWKRRRARGAGA